MNNTESASRLKRGVLHRVFGRTRQAEDLAQTTPATSGGAGFQHDEISPSTVSRPSNIRRALRSQWPDPNKNPLDIPFAALDTTIQTPHVIVQRQSQGLTKEYKFFVSFSNAIITNFPTLPNELVRAVKETLQSELGAASGGPQQTPTPARHKFSRLLMRSHSGTKATSEKATQRDHDVDTTATATPPSPPKAFLLVDWDNYGFTAKTQFEHVVDAHCRWREQMLFYWETGDISTLGNRKLVVSLWQLVTLKDLEFPICVGRIETDLLTIATGPVHHDRTVLMPDAKDQADAKLLREYNYCVSHALGNSDDDTTHTPTLTTSTTGPYGPGMRTRLQFDVKMSQICNLFITPIEVIAHVNPTLPERFTPGAISGGVGGALGGGGLDGGGGPSATTGMSFLPRSQSKGEASTVKRSRSMEGLKAYDAKATAESAVGEAGSAASGTNGGTAALSRGGAATDGAAAAVDVVARAAEPAPITSDPEVLELETSATGGHTAEDSKQAVLADWRITFIPTGVPNPTEFASVWREHVPYWNSVEALRTFQGAGGGGCFFGVAPGVGGGPVGGGGFLSSAQSLEKVGETIVGMSSHEYQLQNLWSGAAGSASLTRMYSDQPAVPTGPQSLTSMPETYPQRTDSDSGTLSGLRLRVVSTVGTSPPVVDHTSSEKGPNGGGARVGGGKSPGALSSDIQNAYSYVADACRKGALARSLLLKAVLPTCQLRTTSDILRQHHLNIKLYAKPGGLGKPKFYGESWVPFFKLYSTGVVANAYENFFDAQFSEKLWREGRCVGMLEGVIVFQDNPLVGQMFAGVHTDRGIDRVAPPILGLPGTSLKSSTGLAVVPVEIENLASLHGRLLSQLYDMGVRPAVAQQANLLVGAGGLSGDSDKGSSIKASPQTNGGNAAMLSRAGTFRMPADSSGETSSASTTITNSADALSQTQKFQQTCDRVLQCLLKTHSPVPEGHVARMCFLYTDINGLIVGQKAFINLAEHLLEYMEIVPWHFRGAYGAMLMAILRRGELDLSNALPVLPKTIAHLSRAEIMIAVNIAKKLYEARQRASMVMIPDEDRHHDGKSKNTNQIVSNTASKVSRSQQTTPTSNAVAREHRKLTSAGGGSAWGLMHLQASRADLTSSDSEKNTSPLTSQQVGGATSPKKEGGSGASASFAGRSIEDTQRKVEKLIVQLKPSDVTEVAFYHRRLKFCRSYYTLLRKMMSYCLTKIVSEALFEAQRRLVCMFLSIIYFRLPEFRVALLSNVLTAEERAAFVDEWRGTEFLLDQHSLDRQDKWQIGRTVVNEMQMSLDWNLFTRTIREHFGAEVLEQDLPRPAPRDVDQWRQNFITPRGLTFLTFLENWVKNTYSALLSQRRQAVSVYDARELGAAGGAHQLSSKRSFELSDPASQLLTGSFRWDLVPGYATLVKSLLLMMTSRPIEKYPDALLNCTGALLVNEKLLTVFIKIVFLRTSVYSREQVFAAFNYVDFWVQVLSLRHRPLPATFDYNFFSRGLQIVLTSDLALQTAKCLWFIYKRLDFFHNLRLKNLLHMLITDEFERLFLSWSWLIRKCYAWILLYRICESTRILMAKVLFDGDTPTLVGINLENRVQEVDKPLIIPDYLTLDNKIMCWSYVILSRHLELMGAAPIFPISSVARKLSVLLGTTTYTKNQVQHDEPSAISTFALPSILPPTRVSEGHISHTFPQVHLKEPPDPAMPKAKKLYKRPEKGGMPLDSLIDQLLESSQAANDQAASTRLNSTQSKGLMSRFMGHSSPRQTTCTNVTSPKFPRLPGNAQADLSRKASPPANAEQMLRVEIPKPPIVAYVSPYEFLPSVEQYSTFASTYISAATGDFSRELADYRSWVISGSDKIPPLHIPASPLDTNVDVPLEENF